MFALIKNSCVEFLISSSCRLFVDQTKIQNEIELKRMNGGNEEIEKKQLLELRGQNYLDLSKAVVLLKSFRKKVSKSSISLSLLLLDLVLSHFKTISEKNEKNFSMEEVKTYTANRIKALTKRFYR